MNRLSNDRLSGGRPSNGRLSDVRKSESRKSDIIIDDNIDITHVNEITISNPEYANPLDLSKKNVPGKKKYGLAKQYSEAEQKKLLEHFVEIPDSLLSELAVGTQIRYYKADGEFKYGGIVSANPVPSKNQITGEIRMCMKLRSMFSKDDIRHTTWTVYYDDIKKLYAKPDMANVVTNQMIKKSINTLEHNIITLRDNLVNLFKKMEKKIDSLEKRIHDIERKVKR
jgi:hypothetical protein